MSAQRRKSELTIKRFLFPPELIGGSVSSINIFCHLTMRHKYQEGRGGKFLGRVLTTVSGQGALGSRHNSHHYAKYPPASNFLALNHNLQNTKIHVRRRDFTSPIVQRITEFTNKESKIRSRCIARSLLCNKLHLVCKIL